MRGREVHAGARRPARTGSRRLFPVATMAILLWLGALVAQAAGLAWSSQPPATAADLYDVAYGSGQFVAVGSGGAILTSPTGAAGTWTVQNSGTGVVLNGVVYGTAGWVAVGHNSTILTSPSGAAWSAQAAPVANVILEDLTFAAGHYVAVGWYGTILTSPNGSTWTQQNSGTLATLFNITRGAGQLVAVGGGGTIVTSPNGIAWTLQSVPVAPSVSFYGATYGAGQFVAVGAQGTIVTSPDGVNWTAATSGTSHDLYDVAYDGCQFVAVGQNGTLLTSPDGLTWTADTSGAGGAARILGVTTGAGVNVAVGSAGTVLTAPTGPCGGKGPDLAVAKEGPGQLTAGQAASYTIAVKNVGTGAMAAPITVTDTLPAELAFVSATGSGWTCSAAPGPGPGQTTVTCTYPAALPPGQALPPITLNVTVAASAGGQVVANCARVAGGQNAAGVNGDTNPQNNTASAKAEVQAGSGGEPCCLSFSFSAGRKDGYETKDGPEPATPPPGKPGGFFDETAPNKVLWHRFTLPQGNCIRAAKLVIWAKPLADQPANDRVYLYSGGGSWVANFGSGSGNPGPSLLPNPWDGASYPGGQTFGLDLASLPGGTSLLADLDASRTLDVAVQDDTSVDAMELTVTFCACQGAAGKDEAPAAQRGIEKKDIRRWAAGAQPGPAQEVRLFLGREYRLVDGVAEPVEVAPVIREGRSFLPLRYLEPLGIRIAWDPDKRQATVGRQGVQVEMVIDSPVARVVTDAGTREVPIDPQNPAVRPFIENGRVLVPVRFVAETLGLEVRLDTTSVDGAQVQSLTIKTKSVPSR